METFLNLLAGDLLQRKLDFASLKVIFPNKRAGLFLADELRKLIDRPMWMPEILTLDEFIDSVSPLRRIDETEAVIKLYKIFMKNGGGDEDMSLGDFYYWGKMLLGDFDDVDKYLVNPHDLFRNVDAYRQMDDGSLDYLDKEQKELLYRFFNVVQEKRSRETESFEKLWNHLEDIYNAFHEQLQSEECAYAGMAQRKFVEEELWPEQHVIVFAGFNALNKCERKILNHYKENGEALFYWDYDSFYTDNPNHEAGLYMRRNLKEFPNALDVGHFNNIALYGPEIHIIDVPMKVAQAKLVPYFLGEKPGRETAVVLCDESMLIPIRNSIPEKVESVNVTMGFPAKNSSVSGLISLLYSLNSFENRNNTFYYKPVIKILAHPLVRGGDMEKCDALLEEMSRKNLFRVSADRLQFDPVVSAIFNRGDKNTSEWLLDIIEKILSGEALEYRELDAEILFSLYTYLKRLQDLLENEGMLEQVIKDDKFYISMVSKLLSYISIPFEGQPLEGMQLMGMMETRMLDFENIVLLSVNEGVMPKGGVAPSFIPYSFRKIFGLPIPEHSDAIFAYYFYRLLQRARHVDIMYVSVKDGVFGGEMSRFLMQLKYESGLKIRWTSVESKIKVEDTSAKPFIKQRWLMDKLEEKYIKKGKILSPSALSEYIQCPCRFYYKYAAELYENNTIGDDMDARMLGNLFHESAQKIYTDLAKKDPTALISKEALAGLLAHEEQIADYVEQTFKEIITSDPALKDFSDNAYNDMVKMTVRTYLGNMLSYDMEKCAPFTILKLEQNISIPMTLSDGRTVKVGGVVDRIDNVNGRFRIIDYKTGGDKLEFKDFGSLFNLAQNSHEKAPFQTMLYGIAFQEEEKKKDGVAPAFTPGAYILKQMSGTDYDYRFICGKDVLETMDDKKVSDYKKMLTEILESIFSGEGEAIPRVDKDNSSAFENNCKYCPYESFCQ